MKQPKPSPEALWEAIFSRMPAPSTQQIRQAIDQALDAARQQGRDEERATCAALMAKLIPHPPLEDLLAGTEFEDWFTEGPKKPEQRVYSHAHEVTIPEGKVLVDRELVARTIRYLPYDLGRSLRAVLDGSPFTRGPR